MTQPTTSSILDSKLIAENVYKAISKIACSLREDYRKRIDKLLSNDDKKISDCGQILDMRAKDVLKTIAENDEVAKRDHAPICQDTGTVWVCLEIGPDVVVDGQIFSKVDDAVAQAYLDNRLRMSVVKDALLDRTNTKNNTPAFCEIRFKKTSGATLHVLLKGGGSDNASRVVMCAPGDGKQGIIDEVIDCVKQKAANACPPLVIGIGIGSTFDKVAGLAKHALLRPIGSKAKSPELENFEHELLALINKTNIGPGALGGSPTAIAVHIETAPCHIAALPLAINMGCCAMRSESIDL